MVKLDAQSFTDEQLHEQIQAIAAHKVKLIGERIESYEQFGRCKAAGIGYFQGYFFCQPKTVAGKGIPSNRLSQVQSSPRSRTPR
jgi:c-di-GMP phosphodiesterase